MIKFTIITCTYQAEKELERTLRSVLEQTYKDVLLRMQRCRWRKLMS